MPFFQTSVLNKHQETQPQHEISEAFEHFKTLFLDPARQTNIRNSKEEQYQGEFLIDLFVKVLGYTKSPDDHFNLITEQKNQSDSKKADGAILSNGEVKAVIELKGTDTKDLDKIAEQAFGYKAGHKNCTYVITSNFEKLRFYINHKVEFIEFNLFALTADAFAELWLCLQADNLLGDVPKKVKQESTIAEDEVTKNLYRDYASFKQTLWQNLVKNHPTENELLLFKKTQKLIDRFLFILFAEDSGLLPPNSISRMIERFEILRDEDAEKPLYSIFKQFFGYINTGRKGKTPQDDIFNYNGGLFVTDAFLDGLNIDNELLRQHLLKLTAYNFETEVDVNILGHIFENSLNEIEQITAQLEGHELDTAKTKRKKDGVFYTPRYITKYIVQNTVGALCKDKKAELIITDERFAEASKRSKKGIQDLEAYRQWLLNLKICDPACGSGAFLNQALDFLIAEHRYLDELTAQYHKSPLVLNDIENHILEQNIFGVDINEESVEIAKLSLWLRTAQRGRKLTSLNNNIKCGNSLVSNASFAGVKAFDWKTEFPKVFEQGGFDVVIGNPPYVRQELISAFKPYFKEHFKTYAGTADLYTYFIEMGVDELLNENGKYSIIVSNKWMRARFGLGLRQWMKSKHITEIIDFGDLPVFADATAYPCILSLEMARKTQPNFLACQPKHLAFADLQLYVNENGFTVDKSALQDSGWALVNSNISNLIEKLKRTGKPLGEVVDGKIFRGVLTGFNEAFVIDRATRDALIAQDPNSAHIIKPFLAGRDVKRYYLDFDDRYLIFTRRGIDIDQYPAIKEHLLLYKTKLEPKPKDWAGGAWPGRKAGSYKWYEIQDSIDYYEEFEKEKIEVASISIKPAFSLSYQSHYSNDKTTIIGSKNKALLAVLNSSVAFFFIKSIAATKSGGFYEYKPMYISQIPIPELSNTSELEKSVSKLEEFFANRNKSQSSFLVLLQSKFSLEKVSHKLHRWPSLDFKGFLAELKKVKVKLTLPQEAEWLEYFTAEQEKVQTLQNQITQLDKEIDHMVYELYGLTEDEIRIVEES